MNKETKCKLLSVYLTENVDIECLLACYYNTQLNYYRQISEEYLDDMINNNPDIENYNDKIVDYVKYEI